MTTSSSSGSANIALTAARHTQPLRRKDKLDSDEVKDLLICFVYMLNCLSEDVILGMALFHLAVREDEADLMENEDVQENDRGEINEFLCLLELCLNTFKYRGKANIDKLQAISKSKEQASWLVEANVGFRVAHSILKVLNLILGLLKVAWQDRF